MFYTKFYPSSYYEYDSRGYITINIPFNGKVVATVKYSTDTNSQTETSYLVNNYQGTPVLQTNSMASVTNMIERSVWGDMINNSINSDKQTPTEFGFTGHKWDSQADLTYAHARYYDGSQRIWKSQDPMAINGFGSDVYLLNPQIQNSYSYGASNPVNNVDLDGKIPSPLEAAVMAQQVYTDPGKNLIGGWHYDYSTFGGDGMMYATYWRGKSDNTTEYCLVYRGTRMEPVSTSDWVNNLQQPFALSDDAIAAMKSPRSFMKENANNEITFVGHSKGGAEAILAGVKYNRNVITFNSALPFLDSNGLSYASDKYDHNIQSFFVEGEVLSRFNNFFFGATAVPFASVITLPRVGYVSPYSVSSVNSSMGTINANSTTAMVNQPAQSPGSLQGHSMDATINGLRKMNYK